MGDKYSAINNLTTDVTMVCIAEKTPELLQSLGFVNRRILISAKHIRTITADYDAELHHHGIRKSFLCNISNVLNQPAAIFFTDQDRIAVLSKKRDVRGNPIISFLQMNSVYKGEPVHILLTVFGKEIGGIKEMLVRAEKSGDLLYLNQMACFDHFEKCGAKVPLMLRYDSLDGPFNGIIRRI